MFRFSMQIYSILIQPWSTPSIHRLLRWMYCIRRWIFGINLRTTFDWESHYTRWWINSIILEMNCKAEYEKYKTIFRGCIQNRVWNEPVRDLLLQQNTWHWAIRKRFNQIKPKNKFSNSKFFFITRPKPVYSRQGLDWDRRASFDAKNVALPTGRSNWPSLMQKTWHYQQGDPTDLLWCKKCDRYQKGDPTDLLWCKKRDRYQQGGPTDLLDV